MSNIPTKAEIDQLLTDRRSDDRKRQKKAQFEGFKIAIIRGMYVGNESYYEVMGHVSRKMKARLRKAFGSEWTLRFKNVRTGCTIYWS